SSIPKAVNGWPLDSFAFDAISVLPSGRNLEPEDKHGVLLGKTLAKDLDKKVGDPVDIEGTSFHVVGIYEGTNMMENSGAIVSLHELQELMERQGQVSAFQIALRKNIPDRKAALAGLRKQIAGLTDDSGNRLGLNAMPTEDFVRSDNQM